jgi:hypothetical protein
MSELNITIALSIKTCSCGTVYAVPNWVQIHSCPMCMDRRIYSLTNEKGSLYKEIDHLKCVNAGLRGALKRRINEA